MALDDLLDRLPPRFLIALSGIGVAATWGFQKALMLASDAFAETTRSALTTDRDHVAQLLAEAPLQPSLNTVSLLGGLIALPGCLVAWRLLRRYRPERRAVLLPLVAVAWPVLAAADLAFRLAHLGVFPGHAVAVGIPFLVAFVASSSLTMLREKGRLAWSIVAWSLVVAYFGIQQFLAAYPRSGAAWPRVANVGGLVFLAVVVGSGILLALQGATLPAPPVRSSIAEP